MDAIFSSTALRDRQREVKAAAQERLVRITENGNAAYVFCSDEVFEREINRAVEDALYEESVLRAIERGEADLASGNYVVGLDAAMAEVAKRSAQRG